jgi:hypothetical protein
MKKLLLTSCLSLLISSLVFVSTPSGAVAASPSDDQNSAVPFPKIKAVGLEAYGKDQRLEKSSEAASGHMVNIPVDEGSIAYLDFRPTASPDEPLKNSAAFRTFFGFHLTLN